MRKSGVIILLILMIPFVYAENQAPVANADGNKVVVSGTTVIFDASKSYDLDNNLENIPSTYKWYEKGRKIAEGINFRKSYPPGTYKITLEVTDSEGLSSKDDIIVNSRSKQKCKETNAIYFPEDTSCNKKWPSEEGEKVLINSQGYSCNLVEVCDENLDFIVQDSIECCTQSLNTGDQAKNNACNFANKYSNRNTKKCQALYLVESLGGGRIYMKDYFESEMCCKGVSELCTNEKNLYTSKPFLTTTRDLSVLECENNPENNPPGTWVSDSRLELNNIALQDVPAHVSINILSTGTCVDYSFALTTLLRKTGYKEEEVYTVESPDHAYNLIKFPLDKKYTLVDTTGNNNPAIIFGKTPLGYPYCESIKNCYNDNGRSLCPQLRNIYGCENVKQSIADEGRSIGFKITEVINDVVDLVEGELK